MKNILMQVFLSAVILTLTYCVSKERQGNPAHRKGANYYISTSGNDQNSGTSPEEAWRSLDKINKTNFKQGDSILFQSGEKWTGQLKPLGSGTINFPIVISSYGSGGKPIIDGGGDVDHVVLLEDVSFWHVNDLEITNKAEREGSRIGVYIKANGGKQQHIHLKNLYVHNISGNYSFEMVGKNTGGIGIIGKKDARLDDILIEGCEIANVVRVGIFTNGNEGERGDRPITNLVIRNNKIHHCAGDGAIIRYADSPLIEYNKVYEIHNADEELVKWGVALWCRSTDNAVFQFNEVYNTRGSMDGQAFDADLDAYRTVVQYNYSYNNEGGFMLIYGTSSEAIVRYNISVNDGAKGKHIFDFPIWEKPRGNAIIHNNTIIIPQGNDAVIADEALPTTHFVNNIFYRQEPGELVVESENRTASFNNNFYHGYPLGLIQLDKNYHLGDPLLMLKDDAEGTEKYQLQKESPCIGTGIKKEEFAGEYWLPDFGDRDFWGNKIPEENVSIGAHQFDEEKL